MRKNLQLQGPVGMKCVRRSGKLVLERLGDHRERRYTAPVYRSTRSDDLIKTASTLLESLV